MALCACVPFRTVSHRPPASSACTGVLSCRHRFISYPRTETEIFKEGTNLYELISIQTANPVWGGYAQRLIDVRCAPPLLVCAVLCLRVYSSVCRECACVSGTPTPAAHALWLLTDVRVRFVRRGEEPKMTMPTHRFTRRSAPHRMRFASLSRLAVCSG